jgi:1-acyl-sn-glycerol-3-phosphate acyltransferase
VSATERRAQAPVIVRARPAYVAGRTFLVGYLGLWHRFRAAGIEHLPRTGGALIVANHQSMLDIPAIAVAAPRHVAFVARATLARVRFLDWLMRESGCVLVKPNTPDRAALEGMIAHLEQGDCVAVFPEGTRTHDGVMGAFRAGAIVAARRAGVPIVPAGIRGAFEALPRGRVLPRPRRISVEFGAPIPAGTEDALEVAKGRIAELIGDGRAAAR